MARKQLIAPFLAGVVLAPPLVLLFGFGWEILLISPVIGGIAFAAAAVRAHYATEFFRRLIPQPDVARHRQDVAQNESGLPKFLYAARTVIVDIRFGLAAILVVAVAVLLHVQGAAIWQTLLLALGGPLLIAVAMTRRHLS
jgi:hypothetical protein